MEEKINLFFLDTNLFLKLIKNKIIIKKIYENNNEVYQFKTSKKEFEKSCKESPLDSIIFKKNIPTSVYVNDKVISKIEFNLGAAMNNDDELKFIVNYTLVNKIKKIDIDKLLKKDYKK